MIVPQEVISYAARRKGDPEPDGSYPRQRGVVLIMIGVGERSSSSSSSRNRPHSALPADLWSCCKLQAAAAHRPCQVHPHTEGKAWLPNCPQCWQLAGHAALRYACLVAMSAPLDARLLLVW
jgi:hypothetical protein